MTIPFPDPGYDGEEPDGFVPLPGSGELGDFPAEQGLFVTLPAEQLNLAGFAQHGEADTMAPGALLSVIVNTVTGDDGSGLKGCSDDQLAGVISAARRLESRAAWTLMAGLAEFASRRPGSPGPLGGTAAEFAADELAAELHLTPYSAAAQIDFAATVSRDLPQSFAALSAGRVHPVHVRIIAEETAILTAEDRARADGLLAAQAPGLTFGELRQAARKLVLQLDPDAVRRRKEAAARDTHVRRFREVSGHAGMIARELPSDEALASWQHIEQRALDLRSAGVPGTVEELRVRAYLDLLQERDSRSAADPVGPEIVDTQADLAQPGAGYADTGDADPARSAAAHCSGDSGDSGVTAAASPGDAASPGPGSPDGPPLPAGPKDPAGSGNSPGGPNPAPAPGAGPSLAAAVTITIPLATLRGRSETPGLADDYGLLDRDDARALARAAARHPRTRWCLTALHDDGTAAAHACLPGHHRPPGFLPDPDPPPPGPDPPPGPAPPDPLGASITMTPVSRGSCDHARAEPGYHPSRKLTHLVRARNTTCTAPGCTRPAARCDLDHTTPWDHGGPTCQCDLAPLCRHHHRAKQAHGWHLEQPQPGVLTWHVPSGRTYTTTPTEYPNEHRHPAATRPP